MNKRKREDEEDKVNLPVSSNSEWESQQQRMQWVMQNKNMKCSWCTSSDTYEYLVYYNQYYTTSVVTVQSNTYLAHYEDPKHTRRIGYYIDCLIHDLLRICSSCMNTYKHLVDQVDENIDKRWQAIKSDISFTFQ